MVENHTYNIPLTLHCFDLVLRTHVQSLQKKLNLSGPEMKQLNKVDFCASRLERARK